MFLPPSKLAATLVACWTLLGLTSCSSEPPPLSETSTPVITDTVPTSPGRSRSPRVKGTAEEPSHVALFLTPDCTGTPAAEGTSSDFAQTGFAVDVAAETTTYLYAQSTNTWNVVSACSSGFFYVHDETPPAPPTLSRTIPSSPNNRVLDPLIEGTAEAQSRVSIFRTSDCTGEPQISVEAGLDGQFQAQVYVRSSSETMFTALAVDLAGNMSQCSEPLSYVHDPTRPSAATLQGTSPASPSTSTNPALLGLADPNAGIQVFSGNACEGTVVAMGFANSSGAFSIPVPAASNTTTLFTARAQNSAGTLAGCSNVLSYRHDSLPPAPPTLMRTEPASPSNNDITPTLVGTSEAGSTVRIYRAAACAGSPMASVAANANGQFSVAVTVAANARTTFYATAVDAAGNVSNCTSTGLAFEHDAIVPALPTALTATPAGPSNSVTTPVLSGTAEARSRVALFSTPNCSGTPVTTVTANDSGAFSVTVTVAANATTTFRAVATDAAGNASGCSTVAVSYTHDNVAPRVPVLTTTTPESPGNVLMPIVSGTADTGSTVRFFINNACTGTVAGTGAAAAGAFRISLTSAVPANAAAQLYAHARDAAGNTSGCSAALPYTHDGVAPDRPVLNGVSPVSPSPDNTPAVNGTSEPLARIHLYASAGCDAAQEVTSGTPSANASGAFSATAVVPANRTTVIYARAEDAAGNSSPCSLTSVTYVHDGVAPDVPQITGISTSPSSSNTPTVTGVAAAGATVQLYLANTCSGPIAGTGTAGSASQFSIVATVPPNATSQLWARAVDTAGNASGCSTASPAYTHDGIAPDEPRLSATAPASPSNHLSPTVSGTAEALATVRIYRDAACSASAATTTANAGGAFSVSVTVTANAASTLYARAWDAAGNASACSSTNLTYVHDGVVPAAPVLSASSPASPGTDADPVLSGTAEPGVQVRIFRAAACAGASVATTAAGAAGQFSVTVRAAAETTNVFTARATDAAGNESPCSTVALTYVHDTQAPAVPVLLSTTPGSPGSSLAPVLNGTAEAGSTVLISLTAACASPVASGVANGSGVFSIAVPVGSNASNALYARARDAAGNASACTPSPVVYVHDGIAPAEPMFGASTPASPSNELSPSIRGTAEANAQIRLYFDGSCAGTPVASGTVAANGAFQFTVTVAPNAARTIFAQATDAAGNNSACTANGLVYVHDGLAPAAPSVTGTTPVSPSSQLSPSLTGTAEPRAQVDAFLNATCSGAPVGSGVANASGAFSVVSTVRANSAQVLYARATDAAGNISPCSTSFAPYTHDAEAPAAPVVTGTTPPSSEGAPSLDLTPTVEGTAEAGTAIRIYTDPACTQLAASGVATQGAFSVRVLVLPGTETTFRAQATDAAGNMSPCSTTSVTYHAVL